MSKQQDLTCTCTHVWARGTDSTLLLSCLRATRGYSGCSIGLFVCVCLCLCVCKRVCVNVCSSREAHLLPTRRPIRDPETLQQQRELGGHHCKLPKVCAAIIHTPRCSHTRSAPSIHTCTRTRSAPSIHTCTRTRSATNTRATHLCVCKLFVFIFSFGLIRGSNVLVYIFILITASIHPRTKQ